MSRHHNNHSYQSSSHSNHGPPPTHNNYGVPPPQYNNDSQPASYSHYNTPAQYGGHRGSNQPTSSDHRHQPYSRDRDRSGDRHRSRHRSNDRDDHHRSSRHRSNDRDRDRGYGDRRNDRNDRNDRNGGYDRPKGGYNGYRGGRGGFRGRGRGGFRGRGRGRGRGGGRGGFRGAQKDRYEISSLHTTLLQSIKQLSLDKRGAQPLRTWIDIHTNSEYQEARFKNNAARKVKSNGKVVNESVKIAEIPSSARMIVLGSTSSAKKWLDGIPKCKTPLKLTFKGVTNATTNNIKIDDKSLSVHQYTFEIDKIKSNENKDSMDMDEDKDNKDNNNNTEMKSISKPLEAQAVTDVNERRQIYRRIRRQMKELNPANFDNAHIYSFAKNPPKDAVIRINKDNYCITLERQYSTDPSLQCNMINSENKENGHMINSGSKSSNKFADIYINHCSPEFTQQGLNILNRKRFTEGGYAQLHARDDTYYNLRELSSMELWYQNGKDLTYPDLRLLKGYKSTINSNCIIKNKLKNKLITACSIHDLIKHNGLDAVDKYIRGKRAITSYSDQIIEMDGLDRNQNLDSTFDLKGKETSFRAYYQGKKDFRTNRMVQLLEKQEEALVIHHRYWGRGRDKTLKDTSYFLPQLLYIIVPVEQHNDQTKQKLRRISHPSVMTIINKSLEINNILSKTSKTCIFSTENGPISVRGYYIDPPKICFKSRGGVKKENAATFSGRVWKDVDAFWYNLQSIYSNNNNKNGERVRGINWAICYDRNSRNGEGCTREMTKFFSQWVRQRNFRNPPLNEPKIIGMDYTDLASIRDELRHSNFKVVVFVLPESQTGCKYKVDITRHVLFMNEPSTSLSSPVCSPRSTTKRNDAKANDGVSMDLQFINENTINKRAAVFNVFETVLLKSKVILYHLQPQLPSNVFNYRKLWMIGIKILRKKGGAHLVVLNCNRAPFTGSIKYITNHSCFISSERDVIPQNMMEKMTMDMLKSNILKIINSRGDEVLPNNIVILRCSGGDGLLKTILSKEMAGMRKAIHEFSKNSKNLIRKAGMKKWYPGVIFSVLQENVPDAFGIDGGNNGQIIDSPQALVVNEGITSGEYFDIFLSLPTKQERQLYGRVIRLIILQDEYVCGAERRQSGAEKLKNSLSHNAALLSDFVSLVYSSIWGYALNIPFPKVPNYPSPIKYAEHYASWQYGILTDSDENLSQLGIDVDNAKPRICCNVAIPENSKIDKDINMLMN